MKENIDQKRARFAWEKVTGDKEYANLAKGIPALIMQSGLMPVLAFLREKDKDHHKTLLSHICEWLNDRFPARIVRKDFDSVMRALMGNSNSDPAGHAHFYRLATEETLALLRWIRQFASAKSAENKEAGQYEQ